MEFWQKRGHRDGHSIKDGGEFEDKINREEVTHRKSEALSKSDESLP